MNDQLLIELKKMNKFLEAINIIGLLKIFLLITFIKISKKILLGSPATIIIGLKFIYKKIFFNFVEVYFRKLI